MKINTIIDTVTYMHGRLLGGKWGTWENIQALKKWFFKKIFYHIYYLIFYVTKTFYFNTFIFFPEI